ncbi:PQQ-dependent sugar dehydrogenase [Naumannella halotolerans]|uniref:Glucose/sorbosone dehydrogenase n=1 Tax=Naumannella halotolerans TaxID=993414 RepID=A0A4V3EN56_9ACTN|nr:PQQ-dependent sugar dehydrogenase [Naumannella halotolerans]TDT32558.1 glucose/sorbosone dehydrogenase [Naumannella halotolerans]
MVGSLVLGIGGLLSPVTEAHAEVLEPELIATTVVSGVQAPANFEIDDDGNIFLAQRHGVVLRYTGEGDTSPETVIDLREEVYRQGDRGLLGLALDPDFADGSPYLYLLYTQDKDPFGTDQVPRWGGEELTDPCPDPPGANGDGCTATGQLVRYTVGEDGTADPGSAVVLLDGSNRTEGGWCSQFPSHATSTLAFGPDGMLYVGHGDGANYNTADWGQLGGTQPNTPTPVNSCNDGPGERGTTPDRADSAGGALRSQSVRAATEDGYVSWDGAILRIDPETGEAAADNPLVAVR